MIDFNLLNHRNTMDGRELLGSLPDNITKCVFFDPQYRGILDKMKYGNEGVSRGQERSNLTQMDEPTIKAFISEIARVLAPNGYMFLWVDKFHLLYGLRQWINEPLEIVDMVVWDKQKIGMGYRTRRRCEYCVIVQKYPRRAKVSWKTHNLPDVWQERLTNKTHTHSKPVVLQKMLIEAVTNKEDLVIDPASGGYSVLEACKLTNRNFLGCDLEDKNIQKTDKKFHFSSKS